MWISEPTELTRRGGNRGLLLASHLSRNIKEIVATQDVLEISFKELKEFYLERAPKTHGYLFRWSAIK